ncbi:Uncharacterized protein FWK35_00028027 [Aphis craccivora]|uniref:Uncharacterized protein n=1 Tax=Aphis craccivora TaxID=307492 RepID=A0A6G0VZB3_APHCR|nr:Uncharacterized protein FWK35_00028027 [Aphis craccivora]
MEEETIRHNKEMEKNKGSGLKKNKKNKNIEKMNKILKEFIQFFGAKKKNINIEPLRCFMRNDLHMKSSVNECGVLNLNDSTQNGSH